MDVRSRQHYIGSRQPIIQIEARLYDHLFLKTNPDEEKEEIDFRANLNPNSIKILTSCRAETSLANSIPGNRYQFERQGYFCMDTKDSSSKNLVFNRTVTLRDPWAKIQKTMKKHPGQA
jgi:glutaminyl-tRNA synthetase